MKTIKFLFALVLSTTVLTSCSSDDDNPTPVNEEEVITTVRFTLTPEQPNEVVTFVSQDLDGDGPDAPIVDVIGTINPQIEYLGNVQFLNELDDPAENITLEVLEEAEDHQVFYSILGGTNSTIQYNDLDSDGNPIGISTIFNAGDLAMNNTLTITLRHEPNKNADGVSDGLLANAGGETDVAVTFPFDVTN